jgi:hypothetical protein
MNKKRNKGWLRRLLIGGMWVHHSDTGWVQATWAGSGVSEGYIRSGRGHGYHKTLISITKIIEYPNWGAKHRCWLCGHLR